jgi:rRNA small subunit pseudouridine methyltransferase Nep1
MITLILVESALEVIPPALRSNQTIIRQARARGIKPSNFLLDVSIHHQLMQGLPDQARRGRPDIIHITLLSVLGSPLCKEELMRVYVHTRDNYVIEVNPLTRLPRVYNRFTGLISQLIETGEVPPASDNPLLRINKETIIELIRKVNPSSITLFTRIGKPSTMEETMKNLSKQDNSVIMIGGFPHGHVSEETARLAGSSISIDKTMLETWVVASRAIYEFERAIGLPEKRIGKNVKAA